jgi:hypothetical protein
MGGVAGMNGTFRNPLTQRIAEFLRGIGVTVRTGAIPDATFLPGIQMERGELVVDEARLLYPGDLLHEAGHLAVMAPARRAALEGFAGEDGGEEMAAIAWSWAAAIQMGLAPEVVFHEAGYRGGGGSLIENFASGHYIGVPFLVWVGLTDGGYPEMIRWLRE